MSPALSVQRPGCCGGEEIAWKTWA